MEHQSAQASSLAPFDHGRHLPVTRQNGEHKGKRKDTSCLLSRTFRKHGFVPLATYKRVYKKDDVVDIKGTETVQKQMPFKCYHGKTGRVYNMTRDAVGIIASRQVKG